MRIKGEGYGYNGINTNYNEGRMKRRTMPHGIEAQEIAPMQWQFTCDGYTWVYKEGPGENLFLMKGDNLAPIVYCRDLREAGCYAKGYAKGCVTMAEGMAKELMKPFCK